MTPNEAASSPTVSVVIASVVGRPFISDCLRAIEEQARRLGAEVIVTASGKDADIECLRESFSWIRVIHCPTRETVPDLRRIGVEAASGDIVAIIEEHKIASAAWLERALASHAAGLYGAVGGPVVDRSYERLEDWVVYFCEYNGSLPPAPSGEVAWLNCANIAYRREVLLAHRKQMAEGYWEVALHAALRAEGSKFLSVPDMIVYHGGPFDYADYLRQRYWISRAFAGARGQTLPAFKRMAYVAAAPVIPAVVLGRMAGRIWRKRCHIGKFVRSLPLLVPAIAVLGAGEWIGGIAGAGDALLKVE